MATEIRFLAAPSRHRVGNDTVEADRSEQQCKDCRDDDQLQAILFEAIPLDPAVFRWRVGVAGLCSSVGKLAAGAPGTRVAP